MSVKIWMKQNPLNKFNCQSDSSRIIFYLFFLLNNSIKFSEPDENFKKIQKKSKAFVKEKKCRWEIVIHEVDLISMHS